MALIKNSERSLFGTHRSGKVFKILFGNATTRLQAVTDYDLSPGRSPCNIGSLYCSQGGNGIYVKVAQSAVPANTNWQKVTTTAAD